MVNRLNLDVQAWTVIFKDPDENDAQGFIVFGDYDDAVTALREDAIESYDDWHQDTDPNPHTMTVEDLLSGGYGYPVWHIAEAFVFGRLPHVQDGGGS